MTREFSDHPIASAESRPNGAGLTHAGRVRQNNEDAILTDPSGALWAVADGMGGYGHGDVASDIVVEHLAQLPHEPISHVELSAALKAANSAIRRWARSAQVSQMGATAVVALITDGAATVVWVGDSRAYCLRSNALTQITRDHSVVQEMVDDGRITAQEALTHPQAHVVTRAVGAAEELEVDAVRVSLAPRDILLLCSDGLTDCLGGSEIVVCISAASSPQEACQRLIAAALDHGAPDNVSAIVVQIGEAAIS